MILINPNYMVGRKDNDIESHKKIYEWNRFLLFLVNKDDRYRLRISDFGLRFYQKLTTLGLIFPFI